VIQFAPTTRVYLACRPADLRKGLDGLTAQVANVVQPDPFSGHLFIFRGKRGDYFKLVYWDGSGLCLFAKRLEKGPVRVATHCERPDAAGAGTDGLVGRRDRLATDGEVLPTALGGLQYNGRFLPVNIFVIVGEIAGSRGS
jgi:IS66 Orf2 like protein